MVFKVPILKLADVYWVITFIPNPVADPGFPVGGGVGLVRGAVDL